jgi:hypothetical protein
MGRNNGTKGLLPRSRLFDCPYYFNVPATVAATVGIKQLN